MSTAAEVSVDELTTDAAPLPPRDEAGETKKRPTREKPRVNSTSRESHSYKSQKQKGSSEKKPSQTTYASYINISNSNGPIQIGSNYVVNVNNKDKTQKNKDFEVTDSIRNLFTSTSPVSKKDISFISDHLNEHWRDTARALNYSDGQISHFYENYSRTSLREVIYQLLLDWIQNDVDTATVGKLSKALWKNKQQDAVKRWSENRK